MSDLLKVRVGGSSYLCKWDNTLTVIINGHKYPVVKIGNLLWMAENLHEKVGSYIIVGNAVTEPKCGYLYQKQTIASSTSTLTSDMAAMIDDTGWRMPSLSEWQSSLSSTEGLTIASNVASKSTEGWPSGDNGTNSNGLNIYPCGLWNHYTNSQEFNGTRAYIWCVDGGFSKSSISTRITFASNSTAVYINKNSFNNDNCGIRLVKSVGV